MKRLVIAMGLLLPTCFPPGDGRDPPLDSIYFPVGLALSSGGDRLYVANSDFDLQYNAGTLLALDAARIRELVPRECESDAECESGEICDATGNDGAPPSYWCMDANRRRPCGAFGEKSAADRTLQPGRCDFVGLVDVADGGRPILLDSVVISAFATDAMYRAGPGGGGRLFMPVRGDATLHWADVEDERAGTAGPVFEDSNGRGRYIACGQGAGDACDGAHRRGDSDSEASSTGESLPIEPYGVAVSDDGEAVVTTHQSTGELALFVNDWCRPEQGPELQFVLGGLPTRPIGIAAIPIPKAHLNEGTDCNAGIEASSRYQPGFLVSSRFSTTVQLIRYFDGGSPAGALLEAADAAPIGVVPGFDTRGIAVEGSERRACETECLDDAACLDECAAVPLGVYLANRFPAGLVVGKTLASLGDFPRSDLPNLTRIEPLRGAPSRVVIGNVIDQTGTPSPRVFAVTFDTRFIYIYDPATEQIEARVYTGRGPHALAIDEQHGLGYVGHFTDSYVGVIDLDRRHRSYGEIVLTLGEPKAPRAAQ